MTVFAPVLLIILTSRLPTAARLVGILAEQHMHVEYSDRGDAGQQRLAHHNITEKIIGAFYEVYNTLGYGFLESVYSNALAVALEERGMRYERQQPLWVHYRGALIGQFRVDYFVEDQVVVEIKALDRISPPNEKQLLNYLCASHLRVGLILNFGPRAGIRRVFRSLGRSEQTAPATIDADTETETAPA